LNSIYDKIKELNRKNDLLKAKYKNDEKYARIHKRMMERSGMSKNKRKVAEALLDVKEEVDEDVLHNENILQNEEYFNRHMTKIIIQQLKRKHKIDLNAETTKHINRLVVKEYIDEYNHNHNTGYWYQ